VTALQKNTLPAILPGYSVYMPPVFIAGLLSAVGPASGAGLTLGDSIGRMVVAGFAFEIVYQAAVMSIRWAFYGREYYDRYGAMDFFRLDRLDRSDGFPVGQADSAMTGKMAKAFCRQRFCLL